MRKIFLFIPLLGLLFATCKKYHGFDGDFDGNGRVQGRLFLLDVHSGKMSPEPLTGKTIFVSYNSTGAIQPLISIHTDGQGYFNLSNLNFSKHIYILTYEEVVGDKRYRMEDTVKQTNDGLALYAGLSEKNQNGFYYQLTDRKGALLSNCSVCVFSSQDVASTDTCAGSTWQLISDAFGRVCQLNIPPGTYYARISANFPTFKTVKMDVIEVKKEGIEKKNTSLN